MKKVLITITIMLIMITGKVYAENITPYRCYNYYGTGNTNTAGTVSLINYGSGLNMYKCESSTAQSYKIVRYDYQNIEKQGTFDIRFYVYGVIANQTTTVILQRGDYQLSCDLNTGTTDLEYGTTGTANYIVNDTVYSVECKNVDLPYATNSFSIRILPQNLGYVPATTGKEVGRVSQTMTFVKKSDVDTAIANQTDSIINANSGAVIPTAPSSDQAESIEETEADLIEANQFDASTMNIQIDSNASSFIWSKVTSIVQANAKVFSMIITCLSLGIIKLVFNR